MMSVMARQPKTLLEQCAVRATVARGGKPGQILDELRAVPYGMRICERVIEYAIATAYGSERDVATTDEYADYWRVDERTGWRHRASIRELFPGDEFEVIVSALAKWLVRRHVDDVARVMQTAPAIAAGSSTVAA
jgi:hypothetical protein